MVAISVFPTFIVVLGYIGLTSGQSLRLTPASNVLMDSPLLSQTCPPSCECSKHGDEAQCCLYSRNNTDFNEKTSNSWLGSPLSTSTRRIQSNGIAHSIFRCDGFAPGERSFIVYCRPHWRRLTIQLTPNSWPPRKLDSWHLPYVHGNDLCGLQLRSLVISGLRDSDNNDLSHGFEDGLAVLEVKSLRALVFPSTLASLELTSLTVQRTDLSQIEDGFLDKLDVPKLSEIRIRENKRLGSSGLGVGWLGALSALHLLDLSGNRLEDINLARWGIPNSATSKIVELDLSNNRLTQLQPHVFSAVPQLTQLSLAGNRITSVPLKAFLGLSHLKTLNLKTNRLTLLDLSAGAPSEHITLANALPSLQHLYLSQNPLLLSGGSTGIMPNIDWWLSHSCPPKLTDLFLDSVIETESTRTDSDKESQDGNYHLLPKIAWSKCPSLKHISIWNKASVAGLVTCLSEDWLTSKPKSDVNDISFSLTASSLEKQQAAVRLLDRLVIQPPGLPVCGMSGILGLSSKGKVGEKSGFASDEQPPVSAPLSRTDTENDKFPSTTGAGELAEVDTSLSIANKLPAKYDSSEKSSSFMTWLERILGVEHAKSDLESYDSNDNASSSRKSVPLRVLLVLIGASIIIIFLTALMMFALLTCVRYSRKNRLKRQLDFAGFIRSNSAAGSGTCGFNGGSTVPLDDSSVLAAKAGLIFVSSDLGGNTSAAPAMLTSTTSNGHPQVQAFQSPFDLDTNNPGGLEAVGFGFGGFYGLDNMAQKQGPAKRPIAFANVFNIPRAEAIVNRVSTVPSFACPSVPHDNQARANSSMANLAVISPSQHQPSYGTPNNGDADIYSASLTCAGGRYAPGHLVFLSKSKNSAGFGHSATADSLFSSQQGAHELYSPHSKNYFPLSSSEITTPISSAATYFCPLPFVVNANCNKSDANRQSSCKSSLHDKNNTDTHKPEALVQSVNPNLDDATANALCGLRRGDSLIACRSTEINGMSDSCSVHFRGDSALGSGFDAGLIHSKNNRRSVYFAPISQQMMLLSDRQYPAAAYGQVLSYGSSSNTGTNASTTGLINQKTRLSSTPNNRSPSPQHLRNSSLCLASSSAGPSRTAVLAENCASSSRQGLFEQSASLESGTTSLRYEQFIHLDTGAGYSKSTPPFAPGGHVYAMPITRSSIVDAHGTALIGTTSFRPQVSLRQENNQCIADTVNQTLSHTGISSGIVGGTSSTCSELGDSLAMSGPSDDKDNNGLQLVSDIFYSHQQQSCPVKLSTGNQPNISDNNLEGNGFNINTSTNYTSGLIKILPSQMTQKSVHFEPVAVSSTLNNPYELIPVPNEFDRALLVHGSQSQRLNINKLTTSSITNATTPVGSVVNSIANCGLKGAAIHFQNSLMQNCPSASFSSLASVNTAIAANTSVCTDQRNPLVSSFIDSSKNERNQNNSTGLFQLKSNTASIQLRSDKDHALGDVLPLDKSPMSATGSAADSAGSNADLPFSEVDSGVCIISSSSTSGGDTKHTSRLRQISGSKEQISPRSKIKIAAGGLMSDAAAANYSTSSVFSSLEENAKMNNILSKSINAAGTTNLSNTATKNIVSKKVANESEHTNSLISSDCLDELGPAGLNTTFKLHNKDDFSVDSSTSEYKATGSPIISVANCRALGLRVDSC